MLLGLDVGTSALKGVLADRDGRAVASASASYPVSMPHPGWSEQDPSCWWDAARHVIRQLGPRAGAEGIDAVGLSGQMHGLVLLARDSRSPAGSARAMPKALRPALLWNDQRTALECEEIEARFAGRAALVARVGNAALTGFTLPKILWVRANEPTIFARADLFVLPKDYVALCLTGVPSTDVGDASGTLLFDVDRRAWASDVLDRFDLDPSFCPLAHESGAIVGHVDEAGAAATGLRPGTPVIAGSGDNQAGAVGAGIVRPGLILATLGTSGVIYAHADAPTRDLSDPARPGRLHTMCAATGAAGRPGRWSVTGCTLCAGGALAWARGLLAPGTSYDALVAEAMTSPPGARGLAFLPHLTGERCPHPDPLARGGWIGLTARHTRADLVRAVVEGVSFTLARIADLVRASGVEISLVRAGGGGARSSAWRQMLADLLDAPTSIPTTEEGPAFGAALLAGVGIALWPSVEDACAATIFDRDTLDPDPASARALTPARAVFESLYERLAPSMHAQAAFDR